MTHVEQVQGLGFGVWGLGFGVWGLGFGVSHVHACVEALEKKTATVGPVWR